MEKNSISVTAVNKNVRSSTRKVALILDFINSKISGRRRKLNSSSIESSTSTSHYSNAKISSKLDYNFIKTHINDAYKELI